MKQNGQKCQHFSQKRRKISPYAKENIQYSLNYTTITPSIEGTLTSILKTDTVPFKSSKYHNSYFIKYI